MFEVKTVKSFDEGKLNLEEQKQTGFIEFVGRTRNNNGIKGYLEELTVEPNLENVISISQIGTIVAQIRNEKWYASQNIFSLSARIGYEKLISLFGVSGINKSLSGTFSDGYANYPTLDRLNKLKIQLPTKNSEIDFEFMESFIAELEAERIVELEAYLVATGLKDFTLTAEEERVLQDFESGEWETFNLEKLFGKSTRGRRLKSDDRISGDLPFVTAGETDEGISALIGNDVITFSENTTTIDMFGSAKYRNYKYGGDDHIAVVHTENLSKFASIFVTTAIHKTAYAGQFSYSRNFYAKDADELNISLPTQNNQPNYAIMETLISAIQKIVIKDVVVYAGAKVKATRNVIKATEQNLIN